MNGLSVGKNGFLYAKDFGLFEAETKKIKQTTDNLLALAQSCRKSFADITKDWSGADAKAFADALDQKIEKLKKIQQVCEKFANTAKENAEYERQALNGGFRVGIGM